MSPKKGKIVLMGSGELIATMVAVHKGLFGHTGRLSAQRGSDSPKGRRIFSDSRSVPDVHILI